MSSPVEELVLSDSDRSNKGASKQRRDLINAEIAVMRDLLPLPESARQRLSQLQVMSLSCVYIRKCNVLNKLFSSLPEDSDMPMMCDFSQALAGFLLITTREGKLVYISENVTDYLGHSMVDMKTQGDSLYDIVDKRDHSTVQTHLLQTGATDVDVTQDVAFFCRMNMSRTLKRQSGFGDVKVMHVRGHFLPLSDLPNDLDVKQSSQKYVFMATCSPLVTPELKETLIQSNTLVFKTVHRLDMTILEVSKTAEHHLGCSMEEICKKSWYSMLHPEDIKEAREKHVLLLRASHELSCMMTVRLLSATGSSVWVNTVMHIQQSASLQKDDALIICINQVLSEEEAYQLRVQSPTFTMYPSGTADVWGSAIMSHCQLTPTTALPSFSPPRACLPCPTPSAKPAPHHQHSVPLKHYVLERPDYQTNQASMPLQTSQASMPLQTSQASMPLQTSQHLTPETNTLKLMLKRKLQSPCHPAKIPKMVWDEKTDRRSSASHFSQTVSPLMVSSSQTVSQLMNRSTVRARGWPVLNGGAAHVVATAAHVIPTPSQQRSVKDSVLTANYQQSLSPPLTLSKRFSSTEQVVPDSRVAVPDSFLTPDPSPSSSPNPQHSKGPGLGDQKTVPSSGQLIFELEKLAAKKSAVIHPPASGNPRVKSENNIRTSERGKSKKELPIMDAFDIDAFFDGLGVDLEQVSAMDMDDTKLMPTLQPKSPDCMEDKVAANRSTVPALQYRQLKQEACSPVALAPCQGGQSLDVQSYDQVPRQANKEPTPQLSEMDDKELDELLSIFSGDMTATQLSFDCLASSTLFKPDTDNLKSAPKHQRDARDSQASGVDYLINSPLNMYQEHAQDDFRPVSDSSSDEESLNEESMEKQDWLDALMPDQVFGKQEKIGKRGCALSSDLSPQSCHKVPQGMPGVGEMDELHQLDKLLALVASDSGMVVCENSQ